MENRWAFRHTKRRTWERYKIDLKLSDYERIVNAIQNNTDDAEFVVTLTPTRSLWLVKLPDIDKNMFAVYCLQSKCVLTVLRPGTKKKYQRHYGGNGESVYANN